jgi:hypothetical protein
MPRHGLSRLDRRQNGVEDRIELWSQVEIAPAAHPLRIAMFFLQM